MDCKTDRSEDKNFSKLCDGCKIVGFPITTKVDFNLLRTNDKYIFENLIDMEKNPNADVEVTLDMRGEHSELKIDLKRDEQRIKEIKKIQEKKKKEGKKVNN
jgi:hypothetical protein